LARLRTEHNGTDILHHYQIILNVAHFQVADGADSLSEMGGSSDRTEQAVADSREWVVFLLACELNDSDNNQLVLELSEYVTTCYTKPRTCKSQNSVD